MLRNVEEIFGYTILATDGEIGRAYNFYFDDTHWSIRYLVVEAGDWLNSRRVLISPVALGQPDWSYRTFSVNLSKRQVQESPGVDADMPVSRQQEIAMNRHYGWPAYWSLPGEPGLPTPDVGGDPNLRSVREILGYRIHAAGGEIGHIDDLILDDRDWVVRYVVVETLNWLPGKKVLLPSKWIDRVSWAQEALSVALPRDLIASGPEYGPSPWVDRLLETEVYRHYGRPGYWEGDSVGELGSVV